MADISISASTIIPSANATLVTNVNAGASLTRATPVYLDTATNTWKVCDVSNTVKDNFGGLVCDDAANGQPVVVVTKDPALQLIGAVAPGDTVWLSATGLTKTIGDLTTGWRIWALGVATATGILNLNPTKGGIK